MKIALSIKRFALAILATFTLVSAQAVVLHPDPPHLAAKAFVLMDAQTGKMIAQKNGDKRLAPASLTKIMTMYLVTDALHQGRLGEHDRVLVSRKAWRMGGSKMFIREGEQIEVGELARGIAVASGNDACVAMAEHIAGNEETFVSLMNQQAQLLGMSQTHFMNSTGMPQSQHYTTADDLAVLARSLIRHFPEYYPAWYQEKWIRFNGVKQPNRNRLLWREPTVDGLKTGHTDESGYSIVVSGQQDGMRLIAVVLGSPSDAARTESAIQLLHYGFRLFKTTNFADMGTPLTQARVYGSISGVANVYPQRDAAVTLPRLVSPVTTEMVVDTPLMAPLSPEQVVGHLKILAQGHVIEEIPLVVHRPVSRGGLWVSAKDFVLRHYDQWTGKMEMKLHE